MLSLRILIFAFIPVMIATTYSGTRLLGCRLKAAKVLIIGAFVATIDFYLRDTFLRLAVPPGADSGLYMLILIIALKTIGRVNWSVSIGGTLIGYILIFAGEFWVLPIWLKVSGVKLTEMYLHPVQFIPWAWIANGLVLLTAVILMFTDFKFIDLSGSSSVTTNSHEAN